MNETNDTNNIENLNQAEISENVNELLESLDEQSLEEEVDAMVESALSFDEEAVKLMDEVEKVVEETESEIEDEVIVQADEEVEEVTEESNPDFDLELDFLDEKKQLEKEWKERTGLDEISLCAAIETIVFMSDRPVSIAKIKKTIDNEMPLRPIYDAISELQTKYEEKLHGIRLVEVAEGYQFRTKLNYASYVETINKSTSFTLSPTALEVLAIIAYRQPISRTEIDRMRGVDSSHIVRALMDKRLVSIAGRSEELGRPTTYKTTPEFLEFFNLNTIDELPPESELVEMTKSNIGSISDIKEICKFDAKEKFVFDDIEELDELSDTIKHISADTEFTKSLKGKNEDGEKASPFELMESFLEQESLVNSNKDAMTSEFMAAVNMVDVVSDLSEGPFNVPEDSDDEEGGDSFILSEEEMEELEMQPEEDGELYAEAPQEERDELIAQFQEIQGSMSTLEDDDLNEEDEELSNFEDNVEEVQNMAAELAEDLDLDLSFMKTEGSEETSDIEDIENTSDRSE